MNTLKLFLKFEFGKTVKYYKSKTLAKVITTGMFLAVFIFIALGIYHFFVSSFRYINFETDPMINQAILLFLYEIFLIILFGITVFSSTVTGIFNLFRGKDDNWILSSPSFKVLPKVVFIRGLFASILPALVLFLPAALALEKIYSLGTFGLFFILLSVVLFLATINALTLLGVLLIGGIYYVFTKIVKGLRFTLGGLITILLGITAYVVYISWRAISNLDLLMLFKTEMANDTLDIGTIGALFAYLPTHPLAMEIIHWQSGQTSLALGNVLTLTMFAVVAITLWWILSPLFYPLWQKFQEGSTRTVGEKEKESKGGLVYHFTGGSTLALFKKEMLVSSRNWKGVMWFMFLFLLWLMQIGANVVFGDNLVKADAIKDLGPKIINLQVLQFIIAVYFISSFALRFVFPSFSVEKKTSWILGSAPLSFTKIFFGKYFFYTSLFVIIGIIMTYVSNSALQLSFTNASYILLLFIATVIFIITLGLSLGAIFPNRETDDPEAITTSMSGLFFTALALLYGVLSAWVLRTTLVEVTIVPLVSFVVITMLLVIILLAKTPAWAKNKAF